MRLPVRGLEQLLGSDAARPLQQFQDRRGFAALADIFRAPRGASFFGAAFFPALALAGAAPEAAFLGAFVSVVAAAGAISICSVVDFIVSPWAVITAIT
jgi:hypothetical protein